MTVDKYPEFILEREFIGYGYSQPNPQWPGGAKICVNFLINHNVGAESSILNGDKGGDVHLTEIPARGALDGVRSHMNEHQIEFGSRRGIPRLLDLFAKFNFPATFNCAGLALKLAPYWTERIVKAGHELSCGNLRWIDYMAVEPEVEEAHVKEAMDVFEGLDSAPKGWYVDRSSNFSIRAYCREHASRGLPLPYSSDSQSDDLPYWVPSPIKDEPEAGRDEGLLMIPVSQDCSDMRFNVRGAGWAGPDDFFKHLRDAFDILYEEGEEGEPKMMTVILHPPIIGRAGRTASLEKFLAYISEKPDVWVAKRSDIASHWKKHFPYDPAKAFGQTKVAPCY